MILPLALRGSGSAWMMISTGTLNAASLPEMNFFSSSTLTLASGFNWTTAPTSSPSTL